MISIGFGILIIMLSCGWWYEDYLVIPSGSNKGVKVSREKLETAIADEFDMISEVSDIVFRERRRLLVLDSFYFDASFTIQTPSGSVYPDIQCDSYINRKSRRVQEDRPALMIARCASDQVEFKSIVNIPLEIPLRDVVIGPIRDMGETILIIEGQ